TSCTLRARVGGTPAQLSSTASPFVRERVSGEPAFGRLVVDGGWRQAGAGGGRGGGNPRTALATTACCVVGTKSGSAGRSAFVGKITGDWTTSLQSRGPALRLQLLLQLVQEAPVGALSNNLVRT